MPAVRRGGDNARASVPCSFVVLGLIRELERRMSLPRPGVGEAVVQAVRRPTRMLEGPHA
jgi:hypothetical protein